MGHSKLNQQMIPQILMEISQIIEKIYHRAPRIFQNYWKKNCNFKN